MSLRLNLTLAFVLACLHAVAPARAVDAAPNAYANGDFAAMSAEQRAEFVAIEQAIDRAATAPDLRVRVLAARWWPDQPRISTPDPRLPTLKALADAAQGSTDPYVLAVMAARCRGAMASECDASEFLHRWTEAAPQDARAWLNLALWERAQGHHAASVQAFKQIATANELGDPHATGLRIALSATEENGAPSRDRPALVAQAATTGSMVATPSSSPAQWCGTDDTLEPVCRHLADLMLTRGSLLDFSLAQAIVDRLPTTKPVERQRLATDRKAYFWALGLSADCPRDETASTTAAMPDCPGAAWLKGVAADGEIRYAQAELRRLDRSVADAAAAYDQDLGAAR